MMEFNKFVGSINLLRDVVRFTSDYVCRVGIIRLSEPREIVTFEPYS